MKPCWIAWKPVCILIFAASACSVPAWSQDSIQVKGMAVTRSASFGSLVPLGLGAPSIVAVPFRLSIPPALAVRGYRLTAVSNFVFSPSRPADGGKSIAASDIGVGLAGITLTGANTDLAVTPGFDYDPAAVRGANGSSHYAGAAAGRANLADLMPGRDILRVGRIPAGSVRGTADLNLTLKLVVQPQFLTPGGFSGMITLVAAESR